jgi:hypothetical protein
MKWIIRLLQNKITLIIIAVSMASCYIAIRYQLKIHHNMMLFGLIISFPLVFALQSAFKRRDRVLEYLSLFSASLISISEAFQQTRKISRQNKIIVQGIIVSLQDNLYNYLKYGKEDPVQTLCSFNQISSFIILNHEEIDDRLKFRIGRYMKDAYDSAQSLVAIKTHGTMVGTRVLSYIFICIFPIIQAQFLLESLGHMVSTWGIYLISFFTSITLAALLLIQQQLEDPFNQDGLDDIQFDKFTIVGKT